MKHYKVLKANGDCCNGGTGSWYLPTKKKDGTWKPGKWMPKIKGKLEPCKNGYHICRPHDLVHWLDEEIFEVEYKGKIIEDDNKCVVREARLLRRVETWNNKSARLFAADCAERVLPIYEEEYPGEDAPRKAIQAARDFACGKINKKQLEEAMDAARAGARAAAWAGARAAAWTAAGAAAGAGARTAAGAAAGAGARTAAGAAAWAAAWDAAWDAAREWQTDRLFWYLKENNEEL